MLAGNMMVVIVLALTNEGTERTNSQAIRRCNLPIRSEVQIQLPGSVATIRVLHESGSQIPPSRSQLRAGIKAVRISLGVSSLGRVQSPGQPGACLFLSLSETTPFLFIEAAYSRYFCDLVNSDQSDLNGGRSS